MTRTPPWRADWADSGPWTAPLRALAPAVAEWPSLDWLNAEAARRDLRNAGGRPLHFVAQAVPLGALTYEQQVYELGQIPTRVGVWHDWFNALVWLRFPRMKGALNLRHVLAGDAPDARGRARDALTLFDECGIVVTHDDPQHATRLQAHDWHGLWWTDRAQTQQALDYTLFGHSEFEKGLAPFRGWTAKALFVHVEPGWHARPCTDRLAWLDRTLGDAIASGARLAHPRELSPLPVLGVPGWWPAQNSAFYADSGYFRPKRVAPAVNGD